MMNFTTSARLHCGVCNRDKLHELEKTHDKFKITCLKCETETIYKIGEASK